MSPTCEAINSSRNTGQDIGILSDGKVPKLRRCLNVWEQGASI